MTVRALPSGTIVVVPSGDRALPDGNFIAVTEESQTGGGPLLGRNLVGGSLIGGRLVA